MRRTHIYGTLVVILALFMWWLIQSRNPHFRENHDPISTDVPKERRVSPASIPSLSDSKTDQTIDAAEVQRRIEAQVLRDEKALEEWRTPIEFYGKVIDQKEQPVEGVEVQFGVTDLSAEGHSIYRTKTDDQGNFSIGGIKGKLLTIKIAKQGFEISRQNRRHFFYAGENENFKPDINNRILFRVREKGIAEILIARSGRLKVPLDGRSIDLDLNTGMQVPSGQGHLRMECISDYKDKAGKRYDWKLRISVPGGGIKESTQEFEFLAPVPPYDTEFEINMVANDPGWKEMISRKFFVHLPSGNFGRVEFSFIAYNGVWRFQSFLNPSGSPNLEFDPAVQR